MAWTSRRVAEVLGCGVPATGREFARVWTDSRTVRPGDLFVALQGGRFDGHDFLADAAGRGAAGAVVRSGTAAISGLELFEVLDTTAALGNLARDRRRQIAGPVIAVTGSSGKTSTKEMIRAVLATGHEVHSTSGNLNNLIGIPLTILSAPEGTAALVVEAGASVPGEIARYREIIEPDVAVITNVGPAHLEGFGSVAAVMKEKLSLTEGISLAVVGSTAGLAEGARKLARRVIATGLETGDLVPDSCRLDSAGRAVVAIDEAEFRLPLPGVHLAANALLAWALVRELKLDPAASAGALERFGVPDGRGQVEQLAGMEVLNDCYNANPDSFRAAIATARTLGRGRRVVWAVGTMKELGDDSAGWHRRIADELVASEPALIGAVGEFTSPLAQAVSGTTVELLTAADPEELGLALAPKLKPGDLIILKASRGVALERLIPLLDSTASTG